MILLRNRHTQAQVDMLPQLPVPSTVKYMQPHHSELVHPRMPLSLSRRGRMPRIHLYRPRQYPIRGRLTRKVLCRPPFHSSL